MTDLDETREEKKNLLNSQTRGMHTSSADYTTFITFEPINRKSGGKTTHITAIRKLREEEQKKEKEKQREASMNQLVRGASSPMATVVGLRGHFSSPP